MSNVGSRERSGRTRRACRWALPAIAALWVTFALGSPVRGGDDAEVTRLRQQLAAKDQEIERLKAQLAGVTEPAPPAPAEPRTEAATIASVLPDPEPTPSSTPIPEPAAKPSSIFDNLSLFAGLDGSKQPQDFGVNALLGGRFHLDWGIPLLREYGVGLQVGTSINASADAVQVFERIQGTKGRLQNFTTVGIFQRRESGLNWGVGYDWLYEQYFDHFHLGQWRGRVGYELNDRNEVGVNLMLRSYGSDGYFNKTRVGLRPIDMANLFYRHQWASGVNTSFWVGLADRHNAANAALGDVGAVAHPFVYGAEINAPLNDHVSLFGQANFITPPSTGTVDAFLGLAFHPVSRAARERSKAFRPVMPVANNPTFAVDLGRRR
jgi:hypothetical protein